MQLTVRAVAKMLGTSENQVYRWIAADEIPCHRMNEQVRFNRSELLEWAISRRLPVSPEAFQQLEREPGNQAAPHLADALAEGGVHSDVLGDTAASVFRNAVSQLAVPNDIDPEFLVQMLLAREHLASTEVGDGIAIPHVRHPLVVSEGKPQLALFYLKNAIDISKAGGPRIQTLFLILSATVHEHLLVLAKLARALHNQTFKSAVLKRAPIDELMAVARSLEAQDPPAGSED